MKSLKGVRIDKALSTLNEEWSRTQVQQWIKDECDLVNGTAVKANYKCNWVTRLKLSFQS